MASKPLDREAVTRQVVDALAAYNPIGCGSPGDSRDVCVFCGAVWEWYYNEEHRLRVRGAGHRTTDPPCPVVLARQLQEG